jgi:hypothetical protein
MYLREILKLVKQKAVVVEAVFKGRLQMVWGCLFEIVKSV